MLKTGLNEMRYDWSRLLSYTPVAASHDGLLFVSEAFAHRLWVIAPGQSPQAFAPDLRLCYPLDLRWIDPHLFVCDSWHHRILKLDIQGRVVASVGGFGHDDHTFYAPEGIAEGPEKTLWVADTGNRCLKVFSLDLNHLASHNLGDLSFHECFDLNPDEETVSPSGNHPRHLAWHAASLFVQTGDHLLRFDEMRLTHATRLDRLASWRLIGSTPQGVLLFHEEQRRVDLLKPRFQTIFQLSEPNCDLAGFHEGRAFVIRDGIRRFPEHEQNPVLLSLSLNTFGHPVFSLREIPHEIEVLAKEIAHEDAPSELPVPLVQSHIATEIDRLSHDIEKGLSTEDENCDLSIGLFPNLDIRRPLPPLERLGASRVGWQATLLALRSLLRLCLDLMVRTELQRSIFDPVIRACQTFNLRCNDLEYQVICEIRDALGAGVEPSRFRSRLEMRRFRVRQLRLLTRQFLGEMGLPASAECSPDLELHRGFPISVTDVLRDFTSHAARMHCAEARGDREAFEFHAAQSEIHRFWRGGRTLHNLPRLGFAPKHLVNFAWWLNDDALVEEVSTCFQPLAKESGAIFQAMAHIYMLLDEWQSLERLVSQYPENLDDHVRNCLSICRAIHRGVAEAEATLKLPEADASRLIWRARYQLLRGDPEAAYETSLHPSVAADPVVWILQARAALAIGRLDDAMRIVASEDSQPKHFQWFLASLIDRMRHAWEPAEVQLREIAGKTHGGYLHLGMLCRAQGRYGEALACFAEEDSRLPSWHAAVNRIMTYRAMGDTRKADEAAQEVASHAFVEHCPARVCLGDPDFNDVIDAYLALERGEPATVQTRNAYVLWCLRGIAPHFG